MSDVRKLTNVLDSFNRADESPLAAPWAQTDTTIGPDLALVSNKATHDSGQTFGSSYWTPGGPFNGNDAEVWALGADGGTSGISWALGLLANPGGTNAADGYRFRLESSAIAQSWYLYRYDNASRTTIAGPIAADNDHAHYMLIRRNGNDVEGWAAHNSGTWNDLALVISATDTTYTTDFYLELGIGDNSGSQVLSWDYFGGGAPLPFTQIYRRIFARVA